MYSWSLSQASGMDSIPVCWKLEIFPCRTFVLANWKNFARNTVEHLSHVLMASFSDKTTISLSPGERKETGGV